MSYGGYLLETMLTLAVVCAAAVAVLWGARKMGLGRAMGPISLAGQLPLDARRSIYLVKVGELVYVVAAGEGGFTKLGELPAADLPKREDIAPGAAFAKVLARVTGGASSNPSPKDGGTP